MRKIKDEELREFQHEIGQKEYRKLQTNCYTKSARLRDYNLRASRKHYENSEERLKEIKEKYKNGVTKEILTEWMGEYFD